MFNTEAYEKYVRIERVSKGGRNYKTWVFVGWSPLIESGTRKRQGKWLIIESPGSEPVRYDVGADWQGDTPKKELDENG